MPKAHFDFENRLIGRIDQRLTGWRLRQQKDAAALGKTPSQIAFQRRQKFEAQSAR